MSNLIITNDAELETQLQNTSTPVLLYFWASWCGPCLLVSPSVKWVADNYGDRLTVFKLEVDPNPESVAKYKVEGVPALRLLKDHQLIADLEGAIPKAKLLQFIDSNL
jgi:thioredoxin 1